MDSITLVATEFIVKVTFTDPARPSEGGSIESSWHEELPEDEMDEDADDIMKFNACMDALDSFVLAAACNGLDIQAPAFVEALRTAVQACAQNYSKDGWKEGKADMLFKVCA